MINAAIVGLGRWGRTLVAAVQGNSGRLRFTTAVRSTPAFWRVHAFGRNGSAEVLGRTELVLRKSGAKPRLMTFPEIDSVRANLEAFASAVAGTAPYPIGTDEMVDVAAAFEAIALAAGSDGCARAV